MYIDLLWKQSTSVIHEKKIHTIITVIIKSLCSLTTILGNQMCFPCGTAGKESTHSVWDLYLIPGLWRSPGEGKGYPLQYSGLENSMNCMVHEVTKSQTQLKDFQVTSVVSNSLQLTDCGLPGSSVHGIILPRILESVTMPSFRGSSWSRDRAWVSCVSCIAGRFFNAEPPGKPKASMTSS